jgi:putative GTP pyrophosphokinase
MNKPAFSKSEIDRLGDRLREVVSPDDLRMLDEYRLSFAEAYQDAMQTVREKTGLDASGRPAKSTTAIVDKLKRESIRLSQMQDIAGCRVVVENEISQGDVLKLLLTSYPQAAVSDRREKSSHGYRAVHLIVDSFGRSIEIQIRTKLQHLWAELSEKLADRFGIDVKYGGGNEAIRIQLNSLSQNISIVEAFEGLFSDQQKIVKHKQRLREMMLDLLKATEEDNDLPD